MLVRSTYVPSGTILSASHLRECNACVKSKGERETAAAQAARRREPTVGFEFEVGLLLFVCCFHFSANENAAEGGPPPPKRRSPPFVDVVTVEGCYCYGERGGGGVIQKNCRELLEED